MATKERVINGSGYRYIGEIPEIKSNGIPSGIFNKQKTDVGGTFQVLSSNENYIVVVPNIALIDSIKADKNVPYKVFGVQGGVKQYDFDDYIEKNKTHKIVVTYDSFIKVIYWLNCLHIKLHNYKILIDEFHNILDNYGFRKKAIDSLMSAVKKFNYVTFMSATPINETFIPDILKDVAVTKIDWGITKKIKVNSVSSHNSLQNAISFINKFLSKEGLFMTQINNTYSKVKELYIFINSVKDIATVSKSLGIANNDVKVVCSPNLRNKRTLEKEGISISAISAPNKKLNFFTSKAFAGSNLFTNNGLVLVVSNADKPHTLIDLETSLYQISGRIRLNSEYQNIFRHIIIHFSSTINNIHSSWSLEFFKEKATKIINDKISNSKSIINIYNNLSESEKSAVLNQLLTEPYFADYDESANIFELSNSMIDFARYQYHLLYNIYADGFSLDNSYSKYHFEAEGSSLNLKNEIEIKLATSFDFKALLKEYIELRNNEEDVVAEKYSMEYPIFKEGFDFIGSSGLASLNYSELLINRYLKIYSVEVLAKFLDTKIYNETDIVFISKKDLKTEFTYFLKESKIDFKGVNITVVKFLKHLKGFDVTPKQKRVNGKPTHGFTIKKGDLYIYDILGITME